MYYLAIFNSVYLSILIGTYSDLMKEFNKNDKVGRPIIKVTQSLPDEIQKLKESKKNINYHRIEEV